MPSSLEKFVLDRLARALAPADSVTLDDLYEAIVPLIWDDGMLDADAKALVSAVASPFFEYTSGHITEEQLRGALRDVQLEAHGRDLLLWHDLRAGDSATATQTTWTHELIPSGPVATYHSRPIPQPSAG